MRCSLFVLATTVVFSLALQGCSTSSRSDSAPMSTVQEWTTVAEFEALVAFDDDLKTIVDFAADSHGLTTLARAGKMADQSGVTLDFAEITGGGKTGMIVRHCRKDDCVSALQLPTGGPERFEWITAKGSTIPVRTIAIPYLLLRVDPTDPTKTSIAPLDSTQSGLLFAGLAPMEQLRLGLEPGGKIDGTPTDPTRKLRFLSAFNEYMTLQASSFDALVTTMQQAGFPDTVATYGVSPEQVDAQLSGLGPQDALVWLAHGSETSTGEVVGMSTEAAVWGADAFYNSRIEQQLKLNTRGGPGIVFLAGCLSAKLIPIFDNGQRIVVGFDKKLETFMAFAAVRGFFKSLAAGDSVQKAIDAANETLHANSRTKSVNLLVNSGVDLSKKLVDIGDPGTCTVDIAKSWQGTLLVTQGTDLVATDMKTVVSCGDLTFSAGDGVAGDCKGCYLSTVWKSRDLRGCVQASVAELTQFDDGSYISVTLNLISSGKLSLRVEGDDSAGKTFVREGTLTPCP